MCGTNVQLDKLLIVLILTGLILEAAAEERTRGEEAMMIKCAWVKEVERCWSMTQKWQNCPLTGVSSHTLCDGQ